LTGATTRYASPPTSVARRTAVRQAEHREHAQGTECCPAAAGEKPSTTRVALRHSPAVASARDAGGWWPIARTTSRRREARRREWRQR
jgi:hypothetical protein